MARINCKTGNQKTCSLNYELKCLFGIDVLNKVDNSDPDGLILSDEQMDRIHGTVEDLLDNTHHPLKQQHIVSNMNDQDKLVLCAWLSDLNIAARHHAFC